MGRKGLPVLFFLMLAVAGSPAGAASTGSSSGVSDFETLDKDGDGALSPAETEPNGALHSHFSIADTNGDGAIDAEEFSAFEVLVDSIPEPADLSI